LDPESERLDRWTKGRAALVGDAAACLSLMAGQGSILAMAEAYMPAGELRNCGGDDDAAFARYEQRLMPFLKRKQLSAAKSASSIAPKMRLPFVVDYFIGRQLRDQVQLPVYGF
jgi:2-polyprenyl-6-methoxyphenol hydroxylase-like FAD-dependent oxidoreductase